MTEEPISTDARELLGSTIDRYRVEGILGEGSFGAVALARHVVTGREVALKVLHSRRARDPSIVRRFIQEAQAATAIGHPNIIDVLDAGTTNAGQSFLVTERLVGCSLREALLQESVPLSRALHLMDQILDALAAAHSKGIIHRDLKPENIFLAIISGTEQVKILDFGISKIQREASVESLTQTGAILGTPHYMAPEQFRGVKDIDGRADLYGASVVLYEMLSGSYPFDADGVHTLMMKLLTTPPVSVRERVPDVPPAISDVLMRGLASDRDARWPSAQTYAEALRQAAAGVSSFANVSTLQVPSELAPSDHRTPPVNAPLLEANVPSGTPAGNPFASAHRQSVPISRTVALEGGLTAPASEKDKIADSVQTEAPAGSGRTLLWVLASAALLLLLAVGIGIGAVVMLRSESGAQDTVAATGNGNETDQVGLVPSAVAAQQLPQTGSSSLATKTAAEDEPNPEQPLVRSVPEQRQDSPASSRGDVGQAAPSASTSRGGGNPPTGATGAGATAGGRLKMTFGLTSPSIDRASARRALAPYAARAARCAPTGAVDVTVALLFSGGDSSLMNATPHPPWTEDPAARCMANVFSTMGPLPGGSGIIHLRLSR